jgi:hypothetical protein
MQFSSKIHRCGSIFKYQKKIIQTKTCIRENMRKQENRVCFEPENMHVSAPPMHSNQQTIKKMGPWFCFMSLFIS